MSFQTRLAAQYSSVFSAGLLAPPRASYDHDRTPTTSPAPSPRSAPALLPAMDPGSPAHLLAGLSLAHDRERSTTPTPTHFRPLAPPSPRTPARSDENAAPRRGAPPSLRKRKSSLSVAQSPLPMLKNRPSLLLRARAGSVNDAAAMAKAPPLGRHASEGNIGSSLISRIRSGSVGGAIRTGVRRLVRKPSKAPPSVPLPPTPVEVAQCGLLAAAPIVQPAGRRPLTRRIPSNADFAAIPEDALTIECEDVEMND